MLRLKTQVSSRYGLKSQPRLVDIIAAVPNEYKKVCVYILYLKPSLSAKMRDYISA